MSEWEGLEDPATTTGVIARPGPGPQPVRVPVSPFRPPDTGPQQEVSQHTPPPAGLEETVAKAVGQAMTTQFTLQEDQQRALQAGRNQDADDAKENGRRRLIGWGLGALATLSVGGGGGTYYMQSQDSAPQQETVPASIEQRTTTLEYGATELREDVDAVQKKTDEIDRSLDDHTKEQRKENMAAKLRGVRQEIMLETLLRAEGKTPPKKPPELKKAEAAVGLDND